MSTRGNVKTGTHSQKPTPSTESFVEMSCFAALPSFCLWLHGALLIHHRVCQQNGVCSNSLGRTKNLVAIRIAS